MRCLGWWSDDRGRGGALWTGASWCDDRGGVCLIVGMVLMIVVVGLGVIVVVGWRIMVVEFVLSNFVSLGVGFGRLVSARQLVFWCLVTPRVVFGRLVSVRQLFFVIMFV